MRLWYLSFGDPVTGKFLGGCFIEAEGFGDAIGRSWACGCNPGGEVKGHPVDVIQPQVLSLLERLLSKDELEAAFGETEHF